MFVDLGEHYEDGFVSLLDISKRKEVSKKFLEQIVPIFKSNGLIIGNRGNQGGYRLAKSPSLISLKEILYATENSFMKEKTNYSPVDEVLEQIDSELDKYLSSITLDKLVDSQISLYSSNYYI